MQMQILYMEWKDGLKSWTNPGSDKMYTLTKGETATAQKLRIDKLKEMILKEYLGCYHLNLHLQGQAIK